MLSFSLKLMAGGLANVPCVCCLTVSVCPIAPETGDRSPQLTTHEEPWSDLKELKAAASLVVARKTLRRAKEKKRERETAFDFNLRGCVAYRLDAFGCSFVPVHCVDCVE